MLSLISYTFTVGVLVRNLLEPSSFLCRLQSTTDRHHGAEEQAAPHLQFWR